MKSIVEQIFINANEYKDKVAITDGKCLITYGEMAKEIIYAKQLLKDKYRIQKGDRIILAASKQIEFPAIYFACHLLEAVALPIAPDTNPTRYELIKSKVQPKLVIGFSDADYSIEKAEINSFKGESCEYSMEEVLFPGLDEVADIIFTTGTTGEPKGVQLSHRNIAAAARNINMFIGNTFDDVEMLALPISHSFGLGRMRCILSNGQTLVMLGSFANVKKFYSYIERFNVNGFGMVPSSWALLKKLSGGNLGKYAEQLHYIEIGSAPMPIEEKRYLMELLPNTRICMHYGLTEASRSTFIEFHSEADRLMTVGKQSPNMNITIRDENGIEIPMGEEGEICVSGDAVTIGYLNLPQNESFWGDAFRTGDWGCKDNEGYISLKSRKKELINVGGKKVSPIEVEEELKKIGFIEDCVCVAIPDPERILGEVVKAYVVTSNPSMIHWENIDKLIGDRLEGYKHPVEYEVIEEIPKTASGKIQGLSLKKNED